MTNAAAEFHRGFCAVATVPLAAWAQQADRARRLDMKVETQLWRVSLSTLTRNHDADHSFYPRR
jgi:hypothetical protein